MATCELVTKPTDGVEITWELTYWYSPVRPATLYDPPEGGIETDGDPRPIAVTYYPIEGDELSFKNIQEGSILDHLLVGKYGTPSDDDCFYAANGDHFDRCKDTRW